MAWAPAHIIVVDTTGWRVYLDAPFGEYVFGSLIGGPELTYAYLATLFLEGSSTTPGPLVELSDRYHAGVVIDETRHELVWYSTHSETWSTAMFQRRLWTRLLVEMWPGWRIRWAYRGAHELAAYLDPRRIAFTRDHHARQTRPLALDTDDALVADDDPFGRYRSGSYDLVTVRDTDGTVRAWPIELILYLASHPAWVGQSLLDRLPGDGMPSARLAVPTSGLHVDVPGRWIGIWTTMWIADLLVAMPRLWPGWTAVFWEDRYEEHAAAAGDAIEIAICDERAAVLGETLPSGYRALADTTSMIWPPFGDHDPDIVRRAREALASAAARVVAALTERP
jgi:hypothetical protein